MTTEFTPTEIYQEQVAFFTNSLKVLKTKRSQLGWLRLVVVLGIILLIYYLFFNSSILIWMAVFAGIAGFLYVVSTDTNNNEKIAAEERLLAINNEELSILNGSYYAREEAISFLRKDNLYRAVLNFFAIASFSHY